MNGHRQRLRVLVVEDSPVARRLMVHILNEDPDLEVVAEAADGGRRCAGPPAAGPT